MSKNFGSPILFYADFELHDGKNEKLEFREGDTPEAAAEKFCKLKGFNKKIYSLLVAHLKEKIDELQQHQKKVSASPNRKHGLKRGISEESSPVARKTHSELLGPDMSPMYYDSRVTASQDWNEKAGKGKTSDSKIAARLAKKRSNGAQQPSIFNTEGSKSVQFNSQENFIEPSGRHRDFQFRTMQLISEDENGFFETPCSIDQRADPLKTASLAASHIEHEQLFIRPTCSVTEEPQEYFRFKKPRRQQSSEKHRSKSRSLMLYEKAIAQHVKKQIKVEQSELFKQELEIKNVSFSPNINRISTLIADKKNSGMPHYERLYQNANAIQGKKEKSRQLKEEVEENKYDFKPKINSISQQIDKEQKDKKLELGESRFHLLYNHSQQRQESLELVREQTQTSNCTFHPEINAKSRKLMSSSNKGTFQHRLDCSIEKIQELNRKHKERLATPSVEPKPNLGNPPKSSWVGKYSDVYSYLYDMGIQHSQMIEQLIAEEFEKIKTDSFKAVRLSKRSQEIINTTVFHKIMTIFRALDADSDGVISTNDLEKVLAGKLGKIFRPFARMMAHQEYQMDYQAFAGCFREFLRVASKSLELDQRRKKTDSESGRYRPITEPRSTALCV